MFTTQIKPKYIVLSARDSNVYLVLKATKSLENHHPELFQRRGTKIRQGHPSCYVMAARESGYSMRPQYTTKSIKKYILVHLYIFIEIPRLRIVFCQSINIV
ncbi:hypothetical protein RF11_00784 [Thelohanellus kitauei]|uniref:Uncharacterized protein n=1 Tax=Thelohanellus kitauei TaxID=669202 RepID=A0A0C2N6T0_THEKT|nr:hypothetical protein RF11_00784 [Thelohanellus kitauei]